MSVSDEQQSGVGDLEASDSQLPQIENLLAELTHSIEREHGNLKNMRNQLMREKTDVDSIRAKITSVSVNEVDRLKLNVGGRRFEIRASSVIKNTYFRSLLSGTFTPADPDGFYFICRDPEYVQVIMNFLRDGRVDLTDYTDRQLARIRDDAEFYMVKELQALIEAHRAARRSNEGVIICAVNTARSITHCFNGIFFEINVQRRDCKLHSIAFVAGERRKIVGEAFHKDGPMDSPGSLRKIGEVEQQVDKGQLVCVNFSAMALEQGVHTLGVYSVSCPTAISLCPRKESTRQYSGITLGKSYHTTDQKGNYGKRAGEDEFDFSGEIAVSF